MSEEIKPEAATTAPTPSLSKEDLNSLREIHIAINWRGLVKGWKKMFYDAPFAVYESGALKIEKLSRKMMTGGGAILGMPVGIILRNTARTAYHHAEGSSTYYYGARLVGGLATAAAVVAGAVFGAPLVGPAIGAAAGVVTFGGATTAAAVSAAVSGFLGTWGTLAAAGVAAVTLLPYPVFTVATLAASTLFAGVVTAFSTTIAAPVNFFVGYRRSKASINGIKLTDQQIEELKTEFDRESPLVRIDRQRLDAVLYTLEEMSPGSKKVIYESLKAEFDAAAQQNQMPAQAAAPSGQKLKL